VKKHMTGEMIFISVCAAGLLLTACGSSSTPPAAAKSPKATATAAATDTPSPTSAPSPLGTANQYVACMSAGSCTVAQQEAIAKYNGMTAASATGTNGCLVAGTCTPSQMQGMHQQDNVLLPGQPNQYEACLSAGTCTAVQQEGIAVYNGMTAAAANGTNGCLIAGTCTSSQQQEIYQSGVLKFPK
jgi:hypothetical protein